MLSSLLFQCNKNGLCLKLLVTFLVSLNLQRPQDSSKHVYNLVIACVQPSVLTQLYISKEVSSGSLLLVSKRTYTQLLLLPLRAKGLLCFLFSSALPFHAFRSPCCFARESCTALPKQKQERHFFGSSSFCLSVRAGNAIGAKYRKCCCQSCIQTSLSGRGRREPGGHQYSSVLVVSCSLFQRFLGAVSHHL